MTTLLALLLLGQTPEPPKGFTRLEFKKPAALEKTHSLAFAYGKVKLPVLNKTVWVTVGTYETDPMQWTVALDLNENNSTSDEDVVVTSKAEVSYRLVKRPAKFELCVNEEPLILKIELRDQFLGVTGDRNKDRLISIKVTKG